MGAKKRVPLHQNPRGFVEVDPAATDGAILGVNLRDSAGNVIRPQDVLNQPQNGGDGTVSIASTIWRLIREIPDNIQKLAALVSNGFAVRRVNGEWSLLTLTPGPGVEIENGDGDAGNPVIGLNDASVASLALADSAVQEVRPGTNVTVDNADPRRPIVSAIGGGEDNPIYPQLTDQSGNPLTDQQGRPLRQNTPGIPYTWLIGAGVGYLQRDSGGVWSLVAEPVKPVYPLTALPPVTPFPREIYVSGTSGVTGVLPAYSDGTNWLRFSDNTPVN